MADKDIKTFLESVMRKYENDERLVVDTIEEEEGCKQGDGFMSEVTVANIVGKTGSGAPYSTSVFIKRPVTNKVRAELFSMDLAFSNESTIYCDILPLIPEGSGNIPKCFYGGKDCIVLENLRAQGYKMADDKAQGLDLAHSQLVMKAIATFHASSYSLIQQDKNKFSKLTSTTADWLKTSGFSKIFESCLKMGIFNLRGLGKESLAESVTKLESFSGRFLAALQEIRTDKSDLIVLGHGDLWINNLMFRYHDGIVRDIRLMDLQASSLMPPAVDLWKFLYVCLSPDLLNSYSDQLISTYCATFREKLLARSIGLVPDEVTLKKEIYSRELFGFLSALIYIPAFYKDLSDKSINLDEELTDLSFIEKSENLFNKDVAERLAALLTRCQLRNIL